MKNMLDTLVASKRLRFWLYCIGLYIAIQTLGRLILTGWVAVESPNAVLPILLRFPLGIIDDVIMAVVLGLPFLLGLVAFGNLAHKRPMKWTAHLTLLTFAVALIFIEVSQLFFWNEFDSRFNGIAINYLLFPREVIGNIQESFDMRIYLPIIGFAGVLLYWHLKNKMNAALLTDRVHGERRALTAAAFVMGSIAVFGFSVGAMSNSSNREVNEVTLNGYHSFLNAALTNDTVYDGLYPGIDEAEAIKTLRNMVAQDNTEFLVPETERSLLRRVENTPLNKKLNVVMVIEESFGASYVDGFDNDRQERITPSLSGLIKQGLYFNNMYATGNRTVRGLEALLTSFPPIPGISTARRPGSKGMNSLAFMLKSQGYQTAFLYGGQQLFDNMGTFWSTTGYSEVWGENDIAEKPFTTIWGAADEYLYTEAIKRIDKKAKTKKPFLLTMLTVSNHRPYVYPEGRIDKDPAQKRKENSATYADWAFGDFIKRAKSKPWFDDTIFIFVSDHGPKVNGAAVVPVPSYRVPLLFYAPKYIKPEVNQTLGSSIDFTPTLLGLLGLSYDSPFFGLDLKRVPDGQGRVLMGHNFSVAYGNEKTVAILRPKGASKGYDMKVGPYELTPRTEGPDAVALKKAKAIYQTAHKMFYAKEYHSLKAKAEKMVKAQ